MSLLNKLEDIFKKIAIDSFEEAKRISGESKFLIPSNFNIIFNNHMRKGTDAGHFFNFKITTELDRWNTDKITVGFNIEREECDVYNHSLIINITEEIRNSKINEII